MTIKTYQQFLSTYTGDETEAPEAYSTYVQSRQTQQSAARSGPADARNRIIAARVAKLMGTLGVELPSVDDEELTRAQWDRALDDALNAGTTSVAQLRAQAESAREALGGLGVDLTAFDRADAGARAALIRSQREAGEQAQSQLAGLQRGLSLRDAAAALNIDARRLDALLPGVTLVSREATETIDGKPVKSVSWGAENGETFTGVEDLLAERGFAVEDLRPRTNTPAPRVTISGGQAPADRAAPSNPIAAATAKPAAAKIGGLSALGSQGE